MSGNVAAALAFARAQIGEPYRYGDEGPNSWDCSGLTQAAWAAGGVKLPRTTVQQVLSGRPVKKADLQPGDLVFPRAGHVQLYAGGGKVIEAPRTGLNVREVPMWGFTTARRVVDGTPSATAGSRFTAGDAAKQVLGTAVATGAGLQRAGWDIAGGIAGTGGAALKTWPDLIDAVTKPETWLRVGKYTLGGALILIGISMQKPVADAVTGAAGGALSVAMPAKAVAAKVIGGAAK